MLIPLHLLPESGPELTYTFSGQAVDPSLRPQQSVEIASPIASPVDMGQLQQFAHLMERYGHRVLPMRMVYDRLYACERLAQGYGGDDPVLRDLAITLFEAYERAGEWVALTH
ncbi:MAG: hypothetical protein JO006_07315 [Paucibacter sp.]|nr:hypothetical protein [Roseateles sp.]